MRIDRVRKLIAAILSLLSCGVMHAGAGQDSVSRPIESTYGLELGGSSNLHTYLSPVRFGGVHLALTGRWMKALPALPEKMRMQFDALLSTAPCGARYGGTRGYDAGMGFSWSLFYCHEIGSKVRLSGGAGPALEAGVFYVPTGGNNPVSARASLGLDLKGSATWQITDGKIPVRLVEEVSLPSLSVFFSQQYGESFYEIYLGNHSGLTHCGWWGNRFGIDNFLGVDMRFSRGILRVGYSFRVRNEEVCGLINRQTVHAIGVAFTPTGSKCNDKIIQYAPY